MKACVPMRGWLVIFQSKGWWVDPLNPDGCVVWLMLMVVASVWWSLLILFQDKKKKIAFLPFTHLAVKGINGTKTHLKTSFFLSFFLPAACISEPAGSTLVLRQDEEVQTTWPGVPEGSAQTGALSVQQGKWTWTSTTDSLTETTTKKAERKKENFYQR